MTSKTIFLVMAIAATLVLGTFSGNSAFAVESGEHLNIQSKGTATCTPPSGGICGEGNMKSKVQLLVQETDENTATGIGKAKISLQIEDEKILLKGKSLSFGANLGTFHLIVQGPLKAPNGSTWQLNMVIENVDPEANTGNYFTTLTAPNGNNIYMVDATTSE